MALTAADKKWAEKKFATKEDLKKFATKEDLMVSNIRLRTEMHQIRDELREEIRARHDEVMTTLDKIMKEVVAGREHDLVMNHQQEVQDKRLERLENAVGI